MEKLCQHLNLRDSDRPVWNTIDGGNDDDFQHAIEDELTYDHLKHMFFYNAEFKEGIMHVKVVWSGVYGFSLFYQFFMVLSSSDRLLTI